MADGTIVHIGENSPQQVAFNLMNLIANVEKRENYSHGEHPMTRDWILKTYEQCLSVVSGTDANRVSQTFVPESYARPQRG